jgi:hypothetical protein
MQEGHLPDAPVPIQIDSERGTPAATAGLAQIGLARVDDKQAFGVGQYLLATQEGQALQIRETE